MNPADVASPYGTSMFGLCASLIREKFEENNRRMELLTGRIERLRLRIESLLRDAQALSPELDATIEFTVSTVEVATTHGPAVPEALPDPIHEVPVVECSPADGEIQHPGEHLTQPPIA
jgi:hypothetical protein